MFRNEQTKKAVSLSAREKQKFDFYSKSLSDYDLVLAFYKWESDYWVENSQNQTAVLKEDSNKKYVIWILKTLRGNTFNLYGLKNNHLVGIQVPANEADYSAAIQSLEAIYLSE